jgi:sulfate permease, SulP family
MCGLAGLTMAIIYFLPKFTKVIPYILAAIIFVTLFVIILDVDCRAAGDLASISGGLPNFHIPSAPLNWETFTTILPYTIILAAIGLTESLLTMSLIDELTKSRGRDNRECGARHSQHHHWFFGWNEGGAMAGQSMINVNSGGRSRRTCQSGYYTERAD